MWIDWLVSGVPDAPATDEAAVKNANQLLAEAYEEKNWDLGIEILSRYDNERHKKLSRNDWYRLRRALEIAISLNGKNETNEESDNGSDNEDKNHLKGTREQLLDGLDVRCFFLMDDKFSLYEAIDKRCVSMLDNGLLTEVENLLKVGILKDSYPVSKSIGYRQAIEYLTNYSIKNNDKEAFSEFLR